MNKEQLLLIKVMEECSELSKACAKVLRFGLAPTKDKKIKYDNKKVLVEEFKDLIVAFSEMSRVNKIDLTLINPVEARKRIIKINKYLAVSKKLGITK